MNKTTYEINDTIQVSRGKDCATIGVVIEITGSELVCWGRTPTEGGAKQYTFRVSMTDALFIGRAKMQGLRL